MIRICGALVSKGVPDVPMARKRRIEHVLFVSRARPRAGAGKPYCLIDAEDVLLAMR